jgi:small-conductance mechanosensitive channel
VFTDNLRESSTQALRLAFQFGRAEAAIPAAKTQDSAPPDDTRSRTLDQAEAAADQRMDEVQARIAELDRRIPGAPARLRPTLVARRGKLAGDLALAKARRGALRNLIGFLNAADGGLTGKIEDLARTVPETDTVQKAPAAPAPAPARAASEDFRPETSGIVGLTTEAFGISRKISRINRLIRETDELRASGESLRAPLRKALQDVIRRSDTIARMPDTDDPEELTSARKEVEGLLPRFTLLSGASAPLSQQLTALNATRSHLLLWRGALGENYSAALRYLLLRLGMLAIAIAVIFLFSELWRRGTMRYVQDVRRRRQILLLRRIVVGCTISLFVILSFVTEFGSIATFAGFSAAGIALAMQSVILSVVAYFFLVGRWGVRVGDRITVSGVTGDVVDIGLFRLYLMEVAGAGLDLHPTGRMVVFPNAVFFQSSALFKPFPGIDYTWCTATLTVAAGSDYSQVERRLLPAVESVYAEYRENIERQYKAAQSTMDLRTATPRPESRLRFVDAGIEFAVRYPVERRRIVEVEDRLTRELLAAIAREPALQLAPWNGPENPDPIRSPVNAMADRGGYAASTDNP